MHGNELRERLTPAGDADQGMLRGGGRFDLGGHL